MTYKEKCAMADEFRAGTKLESGIPTFSRAMIRQTSVSDYLPGGEEKSIVPERPPIGEDLSHLNSKLWKTSMANGIKIGRPHKKR